MAAIIIATVTIKMQYFTFHFSQGKHISDANFRVDQKNNTEETSQRVQSCPQRTTVMRAT